MTIAVAYIAHSGDDLMVANAARRSFDAQHAEWSEAPRSARGRSDRELVEGLAADGHELPFRHPHVTLECAAPLPIARQLAKHQVGFSWSEISRRYRTQGLSFHRLDGQWRADAPTRQGTGAVLPAEAQNTLAAIEEGNIARCLKDYRAALRAGASAEQARFLLPQSMDALWTWSGSLLAWANLCRRRAGYDAQGETRAFCVEAARVIAPLFPVSWPALVAGPMERATEIAA